MLDSSRDGAFGDITHRHSQGGFAGRSVCRRYNGDSQGQCRGTTSNCSRKVRYLARLSPPVCLRADHISCGLHCHHKPAETGDRIRTGIDSARDHNAFQTFVPPQIGYFGGTWLGNTPAARARRRHTSLADDPSKLSDYAWWSLRLARRRLEGSRTCAPISARRRNRTPGVYTTCMATFGNGAATIIAES